MYVNAPGHLCFPSLEPMTLANVSPTPTDTIPANKGKSSSSVVSARSHGDGWIHNPQAQPTSK